MSGAVIVGPAPTQQQAPDPVGRLLALDSIATRVRDCAACTAARPRGLRVIGCGPLDAEVVLVGEAPGADEEQRGEPFIGPAGRVLDRWLAAAGLDRSRVRILNALACRPTEAGARAGTLRNRSPNRDERRACRGFALEQLGVVKPRAIVAIGDTALSLFEGASPVLKAARATGAPTVVVAYVIDGRIAHLDRDKPAPDAPRLFSIYHPAFRMRLADTDPDLGENVEEVTIAVLKQVAAHVRLNMAGRIGANG